MDQTVSLDMYETVALKGIILMRREEILDDIAEFKRLDCPQSTITCYDGALALLDQIDAKISPVNIGMIG